MTIVLSNSFAVDELSETLESVLAHPDFTLGLDVIFDVRGSDINPNLAVIKSMLATLHAVASEFSGSWAVVVSDTLRYGLVRMASSLGSPLGLKVSAFYSFDEAEKWLQAERQASQSRD